MRQIQWIRIVHVGSVSVFGPDLSGGGGAAGRPCQSGPFLHFPHLSTDEHPGSRRGSSPRHNSPVLILPLSRRSSSSGGSGCKVGRYWEISCALLHARYVSTLSDPGTDADCVHCISSRCSGIQYVLNLNVSGLEADTERRHCICVSDLHVRYVPAVSGPRADTELHPLSLD